MRYKLGFLGVGVMAGAILDKVIDNLDGLGITSTDIAAYDIDNARLYTYSQKGICAVADAQELFGTCEIVVMGIKPQFYAAILGKVDVFNCKTVISIMAGIKIATLRKALGDKIGIVRVMPNTPCKIGEGMSVLAFDNVDQVTAAFVKAAFASCGKIAEIAEQRFDAVTSISGSGPAYVYMFADGLIKGGIEGGLSADESKQLALQTIIGAAKLAMTDNTPLDILVERVCSKGGTTIEAVDYYKEAELTNIIKEGVARCRSKSKLLSDKL